MSSESQSKNGSFCDVLIIGAGPAGLMCANALATANVNVRIVDQRPNKVAAGQADGIQPRTIESYGLAERLLREGNQMHMAAFYNPTPDGGIELTERVPDVTAATARYPFEVTLHQGAIEAIFLDSMASANLTIDRPTIPTSISISEDEAVVNDPTQYGMDIDFKLLVELKHLDPEENQSESETVHAKFVLGSDGAHSWVRKTMNIDMEGEQTDYVWGVVDMVPETDFPDIRNRCAIHSNNGSCMVIPREGDKVRLYVQIEGKDAIDATNGRIDKTRLGPHQLLEVARKSFHPYVFKTPDSFDWSTVYIIGQRVASKFSVNERVFIAGDACHTHSPKAGQGMNASMNDTHNLAWKLTHVLRGWANMSVLKTYEQERRKYAQDLIDFDKKFAELFSGKPLTSMNETGVSHQDFLKIFQTFGGFTSGIGIHYPASAIVDDTLQSFVRNAIVGQRMPPQILIRAADFRPFNIHDLLPSDFRFKVLVFTGDTTQVAQLVKVNQVATDMEHGFLKQFPLDAFDIISISSAKKANVRYTDLPAIFRSHWSKVFIDDVDVAGGQGGIAYASLGIDPNGAVILVRPDGYIGAVVPLDGVDAINKYLANFMKPIVA
ncbi:FAD binding domain-containing protein [Mycena floridula]|nr:FAD binding domain-containing protein [Mycena floridula]